MSHSNITRDTCFSLSWGGLAPSITGRDIRRVRLEQLGLILVPNSLKPTELIELVLLNSKEVRNAFFTYMKKAGRFSLLDMYTRLEEEGMFPPFPRITDNNIFKYHPHLHNASSDSRRHIIEEYSRADEDRLGQHWNDGTYIRGSAPLEDDEDRQNAMSLACEDFHKTISKAIPVQAAKVTQMARGLDDVRFDDVWGNFYYISDELKVDASHILLQILLHDWFAVATTTIPKVLEELQMVQASITPYGHNAYTDMFYRLRGHIKHDAPHNGGFDNMTFATLLRIQQDPTANTISTLPAQLFQLEFNRLWASPYVQTQVGKLMAAIWEETSRDISEDGSGCNVAGVLQSLCYALTTDSNFVMGNPAIRDGGENEQEYGRERPVMPSEFAGTSYRLIDAVRIALHDVTYSISAGSEIIGTYYQSAASPRQRCSICQCLLWHAILNWFHLDRLPAPDVHFTHPDIISISSSDTGSREDESLSEAPSSSVNNGTEPEPMSIDSVRQSIEREESELGNLDSRFAEASHSAIDSDYVAIDDVSSDGNGELNGDGSNPRDASPLPEYIPVGDDEEDLTPVASPPALAQVDAPSPERYDSFRGASGSHDNGSDDGEDAESEVEDITHIDLPSRLNALVLEPTAVPPRSASLNYNVRPNQYYLGQAETFNRDRVRNHEAFINGIGPFLYVRASGEHDNIVLPPHLVDSRRHSGNADGIVGRDLDTHPLTPLNTERRSTTNVSYQDALLDLMVSAFPLAPPLREAPVVCDSPMQQAILAILRSVELQLSHTGMEEHMEIFKVHLEFNCLNHDLTYGILAFSIAEFGDSIGKDLRLAIVADNRVPVLGRSINPQAAPSPATYFIWIYHDFTRRSLGDCMWVQTFRALKPMDSLVGHGRESHFWLGVRQRVYQSWRI